MGNQIDHVCINNKWRRFFKDVRTFRVADAGSDHHIVMSRLKLCLRKNRPRKNNIPRLKQYEVLKAFVVEIQNPFQLLSTEETDLPQVEGKWNQIKDVYCNTANNTLGYLMSTDMTCISYDTWRRNEERKTMKSKIFNSKSKRIQDRLQLECSIKDKVIIKALGTTRELMRTIL